MTMLYVDQVASYFRQVCDEDDETWQDATVLALTLGVGEAEFRRIVTQIAPDIFGAEQELTVAGRSYNLATAAVKMLGADAAAATRLSSLLKVARISTAGQDPPDYYFKPATSLDALHQTTERYLLKGQALWFSDDMTGLVRLHYVPVSPVDRTKQTSGDNEYISDLVEYHDVIALLSHKQYSLRDEAPNPELEQLLARRLGSLEMYLRLRCQEAGLAFGEEPW